MDPRSPRRVLVAVALAAAAMTAPARAQDAGVPATSPIAWIERCNDVWPGHDWSAADVLQQAQGTAETRALDAFGSRLGRRDTSADELRAELRALLAMPCFAAAAVDARVVPAFRSRLAAATWWSEGGGRWLEQFVGRRDFTDRWVFPPSERPSVARDDLDRGDVLYDLACPADDPACGADTRPWLVRLRAGVEPVTPVAPRPTSPVTVPPDDRGEAFVHWHDSIASPETSSLALPVGTLRAPSRGWLVIHIDDVELIAIDLQHGGAHIARRRERRPVGLDVVHGDVDLAVARELAWSMLMLARSDYEHRPVHDALLPEGLRPRFESPTRGGSVNITTHCGTAPHQPFELRWVDSGEVRGTYLRPDVVEWGPNTHLVQLFDAMLATLRVGCPRAAPRRDEVVSGYRSIPDLEDALVTASARRCTAPAARTRPTRTPRSRD